MSDTEWLAAEIFSRITVRRMRDSRSTPEANLVDAKEAYGAAEAFMAEIRKQRSEG